MGNCGTKTFGFRFPKKEYISEKSLLAVRAVIEYLKEDVIQRDIFRATGHDAIAQQIAKELNRGGPNLYKVLEECSVRDIASGLMFYLLYIKKPLIPPLIQSIVLDPDNKTVAPEIVALDVLGLIKEQVIGRQYKLLQYIFDLLNHVLKYTPTDELSGSTVPIYMMPIFFNLRAEHMLNWRRVAIIFVEIIRLAPQELDIQNAINDLSMNEIINNNLIPLNFIHYPNYMQGRLQDMNSVLRRFIATTGNRGDGACHDLYQQRQRNRVATPRNRPAQEHL